MSKTNKTVKNKMIAQLVECVNAIQYLAQVVASLDKRLQKLENPDGIKQTESGIYLSGESK